MDVSRMGSDILVGDNDFRGDYLVDDSYVELEEKLRMCMPKAQIEDIDHLMGHIIAFLRQFGGVFAIGLDERAVKALKV